MKARIFNAHWFLVGLVGFLLVACSGGKDSVKTGSGEPEVAVTAQHGGPTPGDSLVFLLQRTPCFGQCRAYSIHLYRSGYATYNGQTAVEREGPHWGHVGADTLDILLKEAEKVGFFAMEDRYDDSNVTDLPSSIIRVVADGKDKKVVGRMGTPPAFTAFVTRAEELLYPVPWKPVLPEE